MAAIFRIVDRFKITGRGCVYLIKYNRKEIVRVGDVLQDLRGNHFKLRGVELIGRFSSQGPLEDASIGLYFELLDGIDAEGNILVRNVHDINFLFCSHPLYPERIDKNFELEYQEAGREHMRALFSYEELEEGNLSLRREDIIGLTVYRGWKMKPEIYAKFYEMLEKRDIILINTPEEYERYHTLPGWYEEFKDKTPETAWETEGSLESALQLAKRKEGPYIVKDYVKSRKHEWYDACFINNIADRDNTEKIINNFINRQADDLVGGIVLRRFEKLKSIGFHERSGMPISEEFRAFIYAGEVLAVDNYWTDSEEIDLTESEIQWLTSIAKEVRSNFVTVDFARKENGELIIIELGDGQVSGLQQLSEVDFYYAFDENDKVVSFSEDWN